MPACQVRAEMPLALGGLPSTPRIGNPPTPAPPSALHAPSSPACSLRPRAEGSRAYGSPTRPPHTPAACSESSWKKPDSVSPASQTWGLFYSKRTWRLCSEESIKGTGREEEAVAEWPSQRLAGACPSPCSEGSADTRLHLGCPRPAQLGETRESPAQTLSPSSENLQPQEPRWNCPSSFPPDLDSLTF